MICFSNLKRAISLLIESAAFYLFTADCPNFFARPTFIEIYDNVTYGKMSSFELFFHSISVFLLSFSLLIKSNLLYLWMKMSLNDTFLKPSNCHCINEATMTLLRILQHWITPPSPPKYNSFHLAKNLSNLTILFFFLHSKWYKTKSTHFQKMFWMRIDYFSKSFC